MLRAPFLRRQRRPDRRPVAALVDALVETIAAAHGKAPRSAQDAAGPTRIGEWVANRGPSHRGPF